MSWLNISTCSPFSAWLSESFLEKLFILCFEHIWLVVSTPLKNMSASVGMIIPNIWKVIKAMFQTTNQICSWYTIWWFNSLPWKIHPFFIGKPSIIDHLFLWAMFHGYVSHNQRVCVALCFAIKKLENRIDSRPRSWSPGHIWHLTMTGGTLCSGWHWDRWK